MKRTIIETDNAPAALGPYSQAVRAGNLLFTSGQIGIDPKTGKLVTGGIEAQTDKLLDNLNALLEEGGSSMGRILKTTIFLSDMKDFSKVNEVYKARFNGEFPARSCVGVGQLPLGALVEIEAIAEV